MNSEYLDKVAQTVEYIKSKISVVPEIGIVLGSGLGALAEDVENPTIISYKDIPNFPVSTAPGHAGRMVIGQLNGRNVLCLQGRFHYYEGYKMKDVTFAVRVMKMLGIEKMIVTNASGGLNPSFKAGDLMLITDHINFSGANPLIGENLNEFGVRFPDMTEAYSRKLINIAKGASDKLNIDVKEGIYVYVTGPSYETPSETRLFRSFGADAVGMSTVPEVIVARHSGIEVLGISCVANAAANTNAEPITHEEVLDSMNKAKDKFVGLIKETLKKM